ncbi:MAG TPA: hypothetical protein DEO70_07455 [Bacteroidales bacterium]|nr:MAG: hypothetical protein A2X11_07075 [Bacteroidetes bacterium GWE2_42_24]OFY25934.1 MAG: hypothetical protein A2X09_04520 [Bacteroidetes bacterium GWF2_43_11]HBZ66658.1 hypothetical protein [Bacteroidales bacterium]
MNFKIYHPLTTDGFTVARLLSVLLHPIILIQLIFIVAIQYDGLWHSPPRNHNGWFVLIIALVFVAVFPILATFWLLKHRIVSTWEMTQRQERNAPFIIMVAFSLLLWLVYDLMGVGGMVYRLPLFGALLISLTFLVNLFWKISIHMAGIGATVAFFNCFFSEPSALMLIIFIISGIALTFLAAYARLKLKAHNPFQLVVGWIAGFLMGLFYFRNMM